MTVVYLELDADGDLLLILGRGRDSILEDMSDNEEVNPELAMSAYEKAVEQEAGAMMDDTMFSEDDFIEDFLADEVKLAKRVQETHMLVSSKHLMTASPVFMAMFRKGHFTEGSQLESGKAEVTLDENPPAAFKILMDILHTNTRKVPRTVDLDTLTDLALLVDKYQLLESVEPFADRWLSGLIGRVSDDDKGDIWQFHRCLCISWVFRLSRRNALKEFANYVAIESKCEVNTSTEYDLPTPGPLLDHIEGCRQRVISTVLSHLDDLVQIYLYKKPRRKIICRGRYARDVTKRRKACDHMMCGSLIASLVENGLWPLPTAPFEGLSIQSVLKTATSTQLSAGCDIWKDSPDAWDHGYTTSHRNHGRTKELNRKLARLIEKVDKLGVLDVADFDVSSSRARRSR
ncbi:uncharacterized protein RSE6_01061 [Rhynchosporium secalis]|uniref:BTB domain-containing protein n=1 Tax=Rhynchosporium secalis TaxID=38038 RepID=A0A1E1LWV6_RHYSE|nr:uncharacterized protein RSE6_01061 [Rhynchosporium secalis]